MKFILRYFLFSFIAFYFAQLFYFPFRMLDANLGILYLISFVILPTLFSRTFLKIIRMPDTGPGFYLLNTLIHSISIFLGSVFTSKFEILDLDLPSYKLYDTISTPKVSLNEYTSIVLFCAVYCFLFGFLYFISWSHNKKSRK